MSGLNVLDELWELLIFCERKGLVSFNYTKERVKKEIREYLSNGQTTPTTPPIELQTPPIELQTPPIELQTPPIELQTPPIELQTPPIELQTPPTTHKTPPPIPKTPPTSSVTRYHIIGNVPLSKDRRKTTFNFNVSFSDNESDASDDLCIMEPPEQTTPTNNVTIDNEGRGLENVTPPTNRLLISSDEDEQLEQLFSAVKIQSESKKNRNRYISKLSLDAFIVSDSEEISDDEPMPRPPTSPRPPHSPTPTRTPLSVRNSQLCATPITNRHSHLVTPLTTPSAHKSVTRSRSKMADELFALFNKTVFDGKLPTDMEIIWNNKLRTTAAYCTYQGTLSNRSARIDMSPKVCDTYDRIRDTLIHELCHAATWIIDGARKAGHGPLWKAWGQRANRVYPELTPISRCHSYEISYKFMYNCTRCDFKIGRHSKSIKLSEAMCPRCYSSLLLSSN